MNVCTLSTWIVIWCTKLYWFICVFFSWFIAANNVKPITKLMRNKLCNPLERLARVTPPLFYETHVIDLRPQNGVLLSIEHCLLVCFMPRVLICFLGKRFILVLFHAAVLNKNKWNSTIHACLCCRSLSMITTVIFTRLLNVLYWTSHLMVVMVGVVLSQFFIFKYLQSSVCPTLLLLSSLSLR